MGPLAGWPLEALIALFTFAGLFVGYTLGRRQGKREGFNEGIRYAPLEIRRLTWEKGYCVMCGSQGSEGDVRFLCESGKDSEPGA